MKKDGNVHYFWVKWKNMAKIATSDSLIFYTGPYHVHITHVHYGNKRRVFVTPLEQWLRCQKCSTKGRSFWVISVQQGGRAAIIKFCPNWTILTETFCSNRPKCMWGYGTGSTVLHVYTLHLYRSLWSPLLRVGVPPPFEFMTLIINGKIHHKILLHNIALRSYWLDLIYCARLVGINWRVVADGEDWANHLSSLLDKRDTALTDMFWSHCLSSYRVSMHGGSS